MTELRNRVLARVQRCIDEGIFPATVQAVVALRLLWAPVIGITAFQLSHRLPADVDADALVRDAIDTTIAGLRAGAPTHSRALAPDLRQNHKGIMSPIIHQVALKRALTTTGPRRGALHPGRDWLHEG